jgi:hypothetical protein
MNALPQTFRKSLTKNASQLRGDRARLGSGGEYISGQKSYRYGEKCSTGSCNRQEKGNLERTKPGT